PVVPGWLASFATASVACARSHDDGTGPMHACSGIPAGPRRTGRSAHARAGALGHPLHDSGGDVQPYWNFGDYTRSGHRLNHALGASAPRLLAQYGTSLLLL